MATKKLKYKVKADVAELYGFDGKGFFKMEHIPMPPYKKDAVVPGILRKVKADDGKTLFGVQISKFHFLRPEDVAQLDEYGKETLSFTNEGGERLEKHTGVFAETLPDSPVDGYLSAQGKKEQPENKNIKSIKQTDAESMFKLQRPRPVFKVEDDKLIKTGETLKTDERISAKPVTMVLRDKKRMLLEFSPNKYIQHIAVEPVSLFDMNADAGAKPAENAPIKKFMDGADCLAHCDNVKPTWIHVIPVVGVALGAILAHQRKSDWLEFAALMAGGGAAGYAAVLVGTKMTKKEIVKK